MFPPMMTSFVTHGLVFPSSLRATLSDIVSLHKYVPSSIVFADRESSSSHEDSFHTESQTPAHPFIHSIPSCLPDIVPQTVL
ncbi:hypothetical protein BDZ97DRAFT_1828980, partial [Flammula alnicola]